MKIALVTSVDPVTTGGVQWSIFRVSQMLIDLGFSVDILYCNAGDDVATNCNLMGTIVTTLYDDAVTFYRISSWSGHYSSNQYKNNVWENLAIDHWNSLRVLAKRNMYRVIHVFHADGILHIANEVAVEIGIPVIASLRGIDLNGSFSDWKLRTLLQENLSKVQAVTLMNLQMLNRVKLLLQSDLPCHLIYNSTSSDYFNKIPVDFNCDEDRVKIIYVGNANPRRGWNIIPGICKKLVDRQHRVHLITVGISKLERLDLKMFEKYNITHVTLDNIPHQHVVSYIEASDLLIHPKLEDGCSNAVLEAMLAKTPVVASETGAIPDLLTHRKSAMLFEPGAVDDAVNCIEELVLFPELGYEIAEQAYKIVDEQLHPSIEKSKWRVLYESIL